MCTLNVRAVMRHLLDRPRTPTTCTTRISFKTIPPNFCSARQLSHTHNKPHPPHQCAHASELKSVKAERLLLRQLSSQAHPASEPNPASKLRRISESFHSRPSSALVLIAPSRARSCPNSAVIPYPILSPHRPPPHKPSRHPATYVRVLPASVSRPKRRPPPNSIIGQRPDNWHADGGQHRRGRRAFAIGPADMCALLLLLLLKRRLHPPRSIAVVRPCIDRSARTVRDNRSGGAGFFPLCVCSLSRAPPAPTSPPPPISVRVHVCVSV